jgi:hypothetical protein
MPAVFREIPPIELVQRFLEGFGIQSLLTSGWFTKDHANIPILEEILPELEAYYTPCKAIQLLHSPLTPEKSITIVRQLLKAHSIQLQVNEKSRFGEKTTWYHIIPKACLPEGDTINFS